MPGPVGVLQAKAAGVHVRVIRESTPEVVELQENVTNIRLLN
jgi:hypothetical protein